MEELKRKIADILIGHSITECHFCGSTLECPDEGTEDALIDALKEQGIYFENDNTNYEWKGKIVIKPHEKGYLIFLKEVEG